MAQKTKEKKSTSPRKKTAKRKKKKQKKSWKRGLLLFALYATLTGILLGGLFFLSVWIGVFGKLPNHEELAHIKNDYASDVYSSDGKLMGRYFIQNRSSASFEEIPTVAVNALVATEDSRFFEHQGVDPLSVLRVLFRTIILRQHHSGGGSTISQQLAKNLFGRQDHGFLTIPVDKLKENILAIRLEDIYSKDQIITLYLNTVPFGENVYGIKAASERFFGKPPEKLSTEEAAVLVGMLKAPTSFNPRLHNEASRERRNVVLSQMVKYNYITAEKAQELEQKPLEINYTRFSGSYGVAPYLRAGLEDDLANMVSKYNKPDGTPYNLYTDGLKIYLTVNAQLQKMAEEAVEEHMTALQKTFDTHWGKRDPWGSDDSFIREAMKGTHRYHTLKDQGLTDKQILREFKKPTSLLVYTPDGYKRVRMSPLDSIKYHQKLLQCAVLGMNAHTGAVLAWVGGLDQALFPYDHVIAKRQVGSTFKPIVYAAALENGADPCNYISAAQDSFPDFDNYKPGNAEDEYDGYYSMKGALAHSINTVSVKILMHTGLDSTIEFAHNLGIDSDLPRGPSLALGTADIDLWEMVHAYCSFINQGRLPTPYFVSRIETSDGKVLAKFDPEVATPVMSHTTAQEIRLMMQAVVDSGTGRRAHFRYGIKIPLAGKTGTTQNNSDGWFIGCTPNIVLGAWVGGDNPSVRFRSTALGQGANMALPIVALTLQKAQKDKTMRQILGSQFPNPDPQVLLDMSCPSFIKSRIGGFFDQLFNGNQQNKKKELKEKIQQEHKSGNQKDKKEKPGFFERLFGNHKKK